MTDSDAEETTTITASVRHLMFHEIVAAAEYHGYCLTPLPMLEHGRKIHPDDPHARARFVILNTALDWEPEEGPPIGHMAVDALLSAGFQITPAPDDETRQEVWELSVMLTQNSANLTQTEMDRLAELLTAAYPTPAGLLVRDGEQ